MAERVSEKVDESLKADIMHWAAFYVCAPFFEAFANILIPGKEHRMCMGNKKIYHLEAWVVKVMSLYKVRCRLFHDTAAQAYIFLSALLL